MSDTTQATDSNAEFDMGADGEPVGSPDALVRVQSSIQEMIALEEAIATMDDDLKAARKSLQTIKTVNLPDLLAEIQSDHFNHGGWEVKLTDFVSGSLPKDPDKRTVAMDWLKDHDGGELIKTDVSMSFGKSQHNEAVNIAEDLIAKGYAVNVNEGVHAATLQSYARTRIRDGDEIDTEILGLYVGKVVKTKKLS